MYRFQFFSGSPLSQTLQWTKWPCLHYVFVAYRIIIALYMTGVYTAAMTGQIGAMGGLTFVYLTTLAATVVVIYLLVAAFIAWLDGVVLRTSSNRGGRSRVMEVSENYCIGLLG